MSKPQMKINPSALEEAGEQLTNARKVLASIQEINHREGVLNEHVFHSEKVAQKLVEKLEKEVARRERHSGDKFSAQTGRSKLA